MLPEYLPSLSTKLIIFIIYSIFEFLTSINATTTTTPCMPIFFAQAISSRQVKTMELYFTKDDVKSASECANLCGQRHFFCKSAIYNHDVHTCALSPNKPIQCSLSKQRFNYFHLKTDGADAISIISCIEICQQQQQYSSITASTLNSNLNENINNKEETSRTTIKQQEIVSPKFSPILDDEKKSFKNKKVDEITKFFPLGNGDVFSVLERLYQMKQRLQQIVGEANRNGGGDGGQGQSKGNDDQTTNNTSTSKQIILAKDIKQTKINTSKIKSSDNNNDTDILIQSGGFVARLKPDERVKKVYSKIKSINNKQQILKNNVTIFNERKKEDGEGQDYNDIDEEPIIINGKLIEPATGYLHSIFIHHNGGSLSSSSSFEDEDKTTTTKNILLSSLDIAKLSSKKINSNEKIICFRFIKNRNLLDNNDGTTNKIIIKIMKGLNLNECRCACANTWRNEETKICKSLHYYNNGICELLNLNHEDKTDLIYNKTIEYHYITCEKKYLLKTADKMCKNITTKTTTIIPLKEITKKVEETITINIPSIEQPSTSTSTTQSTTTTSTSSTFSSVNSSTSINESIISSSDKKCFEYIKGYIMNGTAASLEHNITLNQCKCLCANSINSLYPFNCASVNYFENEQDCILNLHNRQTLPEQFNLDETDNQNVIYLGFLCNSKEDAKIYVNNYCDNNNDSSMIEKKNFLSSSTINSIESEINKTISNSSQTSLNSSSSLKQDKELFHTSLSDSCFVEQPGYVLEGIALEARQQVSGQLCKCICALAELKQQQKEDKEGKGCRSSQFYFHSGTCLISGENRASAPERFIFDENNNGIDGYHSSYLDFRCGADKKSLYTYLENNCPKEGKTFLINSTNTIEESIKEEQQKGLIKNNIKEELLSTTSTIIINSEKDDEQLLEIKTAIPSIESNKPIELESIEKGENWKTIHVQGEEKHNQNKANEEGDEKEEEEEDDEDEKDFVKVTSQAQADQPPKEEVLQNRNENISTTITSTNGSTIDTTTSLNDTSIKESIATSTTFNESSINITLLQDITNNITNNFINSTTTESSSLYSSSSTGNLFEYPAVGQCHFSALYQTVFNGARLLKRLLVDTPAQCLSACHYESCRSANLIQMEDKQKICELFRDSIVEFRRNDVLSFDRLAVHFDSIQCQPRSE